MASFIKMHGDDRFMRITAGLLSLFTAVFMVLRSNIGEIYTITNITGWLCVIAFGIVFLLTGKRISALQSAWIILITSMSAMALIGFSGNGLGLPAIVLFPVAPLLAILLADLMAAIFISVSSVLLIIIFIYLEISGYPFSPSPLPENMENIMRGSWLIFSIILITMIGWYYRVKVDALLLKLQSQADTDHLTEIANRRSLEDSLHREFYRIKRSGGWLSLLLIDIDNFKKVNDKDGHLKGDECLVSIAKQIKYHCKRAIDVVGRYGGDEFMVVLPDTAPNEAEDISEKIRVSIESLNFDIADDIKISATIGCFSIIDPEDMDTQAVIERVDQLLYEGKSVGRNIVITGIEEGGLD